MTKEITDNTSKVLSWSPVVTKEIKVVDAEKYRVKIIASTPTVDRQGQVVVQSGWQLDEFKKSPRILADHDISIDKIIGRAIPETVKINDDGNLEMEIVFAYDESDLAKTAYKLYKGGFLNTVSVGFIGYDGEMRTMEVDGKPLSVWHFTKQSLYEVSFVAVPANPEAVTRAMKGMQKAIKKGVITESESTAMSDFWGKSYEMNKKELEIEKKLTLLAETHEEKKLLTKHFSRVNKLIGFTPSGELEADSQKALQKLELLLTGIIKASEDPAATPQGTAKEYSDPVNHLQHAKALAMASLKAKQILSNR